MSHYKPYPKYKDSGIEWLGEVPEHWSVERLKNSIESCRNGIWGEDPSGGSSDLPCVRVADFDRLRLMVVLDNPTIRSIKPSELNGRVMKRGDLVLEKSGGGEKQPVGFVVLYDDDRPAVCSNFTARMNLADGMNPSFWRYVHAAAYSIRLNVPSIKQTSGIQNLDQHSYLNERAAYPPSDEQAHIASFLDHETSRIDNMMTKKQRFIELLKERSQALISQAVTKGLNPNVKMKDSGVTAIGKVPFHWETKPLRSEMSFKKHSVGGSWEKYSLLSLTRKGVILRDVSENFGKFPESFETYQKVDKNELVMCLFDIDETPRTVGLSSFDGMITGAYSVFLIENEIYREYLYQTFIHLDNAKGMKPYYSGLRKTIRPSRLLGIHFPFPPEEEAKAICDHINKGTDRIDRLITRTQRSIDLLKERRAALITAAVTGKIDLRDDNGKEAA